jgi:hypothetical protein
MKIKNMPKPINIEESIRKTATDPIKIKENLSLHFLKTVSMKSKCI